MELISKEDAVALIKAEMDKIRTHSLVDGTARINLRLAKNIIEDMPGIDLADYVPKDFHDKTCEAMAKAHQEEIADMVRIADRPQGEWIDKAISIIDDMQREDIVDYEQAKEFRMRARLKGADDESS